MIIMSDILKHTVFFVNMLGLVVLAGGLVARKIGREDPGIARQFILLSVVVVLVKLFYILVFYQLAPERIFSTDGNRYFFEIQGIASAPWRWNPIEGTGPQYSVSAKMGMSYVYGLILFVHRIDSLFGVLGINLVMAYLTSVMVFLLTMRISDHYEDGLLAFVLCAIYPETLFWNARVVRENFVLLLVPLLVYAAIRLYETQLLRYLAVALMATFLLAITRAQLALLFPLVLAYFGVTVVCGFERKKVLATVGIMSLLFVLLRGFIENQIRAAIGSDLLRYMTVDPVFWVRQLENFIRHAPHLLSVYARQEHGLLGIFLVPVFVSAMALLALTFINFKKIFTKSYFAAGLMAFLTVAFVFVVATFGLINIRFRATVAPLALSLVSVSIGYYWRSLAFPRIALFRSWQID